MTQLARWNPFRSLSRTNQANDFEDFFRGFNLKPFFRDFDTSQEVRIDVAEDEKNYTVKADIPGVNKEDINVAVEGRELTVSAEVKHELERKDETDVYSERYRGKVYRSLTLPAEIDSSNAQARYDNGVLTLILPKTENSRTRRINID